MSKSWLIGGLSLGLAVSVGIWLIASEKGQDPELSSYSESNKLTATAKQNTGTESSFGALNQAAQIPTPDEVQFSEQVTEQITEQVEDALLQFDEISKYPPTSQPILSEEHVNAFINSSLPQSSLPFPFDGLETPIQVSIELDQNNYFFGDQIKAKVNISDTPEEANITTRAVLMSIEGETLVESGYQETKENTTFIIFDTQSYLTDAWPIEMNVGAYIDVNGHSIFITAPFKINNETASLDSIGFSEPIAENLVIPVNLNVKLAGYYYVAGVLYSAKSQQALIHLETEGRLTEGFGSLNLNAHIQALKKGGDEGPYYLDKIRIERWSDELIPRDIAGKVDQSEYLVDGYSFKDYENKDYLDPLAEERKRLLQGLSSRL
tara:strand:- start:46861 stop:47997 length:1137 start_codon:yes stop_codon:yes gene_type:complete